MWCGAVGCGDILGVVDRRNDDHDGEDDDHDDDHDEDEELDGPDEHDGGW